MKRVFQLVSIAMLFSIPGCLYVGQTTAVPERTVTVVDEIGTPITNYNMHIYRCTLPGSKFDKVFSFPNQTTSEFRLIKQSEPKLKQAGGVLLAPDFYMSFEPQPYWVACIEKQGYASRRWSLGDEEEATNDESSVKVILSKGQDAGPDTCEPKNKKCGPCQSYEYFLYQPTRYRHSDCEGVFE